MDSVYVAYLPDQFPHIAVRGSDEQLSMAERRAWRDVQDVAIANATGKDVAREVNRESDLYIWWVQFVFRRLRSVTIRSEEFQRSRASLIDDQSMSELRNLAGLSLTEFRDSSLHDVFALIEEKHSAKPPKKPPTKPQASKNDLKKLDFYNKLLESSPGMIHSEVATRWNEKFAGETQTDESIRQAVSKGRKRREWERDNS